jgi:hypothetical protein
MCSPGNLAGDSSEFCAVLAANGAVEPLAQVLLRALPAGAGAARDAAAATAAWALSNILWGAPNEVPLL